MYLENVRARIQTQTELPHNPAISHHITHVEYQQLTNNHKCFLKSINADFVFEKNLSTIALFLHSLVQFFNLSVR